MATEIETLVTRGTRVRVRRAGKGKPILFLHGAGGWPAWLPFFERLSQRFAVAVPEHPGFGGSDDPHWLRDVPDLAMYYLDVLDAAFASPVHVIGHSLGGWTAAEAAVRNTRHIASLTLHRAGRHPRQRRSARRQFHLVARGGDPQPLSQPELCRGLAGRRRRRTRRSSTSICRTAWPRVKFGWEPRWFNPALEKWLHRIACADACRLGRAGQDFAERLCGAVGRARRRRANHDGRGVRAQSRTSSSAIS